MKAGKPVVLPSAELAGRSFSLSSGERCDCLGLSEETADSDFLPWKAFDVCGFVASADRFRDEFIDPAMKATKATSNQVPCRNREFRIEQIVMIKCNK